MKQFCILALWVVGIGGFIWLLIWLLIDKDVFGAREMARRREAHEAADKACIAFCRDVEAVAVGDGGVCACPVRSPE